jgi:hypothetical protein
MVCEFITCSFMALCLFTVLLVQCWSDKNLICLVSNRIFVLIISCFCSLVLMLNNLRYASCCSCFCCLSYFPKQVDHCRWPREQNPCLFVFSLVKVETLLTYCSETWLYAPLVHWLPRRTLKQGKPWGSSRQTSTPHHMSTPLHQINCPQAAEVCDKVPRTTPSLFFSVLTGCVTHFWPWT